MCSLGAVYLESKAEVVIKNLYKHKIISLPYLIVGILMCAVSSGVFANNILETYPEIKNFFPGLTHVGDIVGEPPTAPVYQQHELLGYVFSTKDFAPIPAYSGKPINILVGLNLSGRITGLKIIEHHEPILLVGVSEKQLKKYIDQYKGVIIFDRVRVGAEKKAGSVGIDTISGATITVMVSNATIVNSARTVAAIHGITRDKKTSKPPPVLLTRRAPLAAEKKPVQPETQLNLEELGLEQAWVTIWEGRAVEIGILIVSLILLTAIMLFQDWIVKRPTLYEYLRNGFLLFTVFFIGGYALAQLSIVNVLTFVHAFMHDFRWETFALDPLIFILWAFVAFTLLLWGRGVYCGWLCPFGAMQELINMTARHFKVKQWEFPTMVHERLWAIKYVVLISLFGLSLQSISLAEQYAEIEPFKTTILRFDRPWPFVLYVVVLLLISVFNRKFYCKYICPLAAALIIPAQNRVFDWVRRRNECGKPCQVCANLCEVQAIAPTGEINKNECHYCLDCQVTYWNEYKCPPLVRERKKRERRLNAG